MARCHQVINHYMNQCEARSMSLNRPQRVDCAKLRRIFSVSRGRALVFDMIKFTQVLVNHHFFSPKSHYPNIRYRPILQSNSIYIYWSDLQFSTFFINDEETLLVFTVKLIHPLFLVNFATYNTMI